MAILSKKVWKKHTNPWSGWTRILGFYFIPVAIWYHNWYFLAGLIVFFAVNPFLFPEPKSKDNWMSKSILGEEVWHKKGLFQKDIPTVLNIFNGIFFGIMIYGAYTNLLEVTVSSTILSGVFKLWFLDRMVFYYKLPEQKLF
ncbi:hypothetical protein JYT51_00715 [Candidatus Amoebophilus asiaticus]|nr:hypothetical protein [Candidatus Amoebophilus asiaticus]